MGVKRLRAQVSSHIKLFRAFQELCNCPRAIVRACASAAGSCCQGWDKAGTPKAFLAPKSGTRSNKTDTCYMQHSHRIHLGMYISRYRMILS